ncbi:hypothetical protein K4L44_08175 [Halosquirtibacter laminarini]|uniref:Uncharacterized protein n=1 Tax=Halosquirtibacter laminarini TaxID=3374600 RepID=A0AC61NJ73_9BACT|nr:hypothetical protein K4L44_08175 [Prolixibacteraceae bacterium]
MTGGKSNHLGTPQGGVISPLLANIYMNLLDRIVNNRQSLFGVSGVKMIRYADDFVLMGKIITTEVKDQLHHLLTRMDLILNIEKTKHIDSKEASFKFLGFTFRNDKDLYGRDLRYINIVPNSDSEKSYEGKYQIILKGMDIKTPRSWYED